ncbi:MAG: hypothetical protein B5766_07905 [Candidatus Lumbricidophila eiseniae]|uniref:DNA 3'-5' helicase n=1 Tax=Candidatus Lumbricidiphila eiseniae TaxID=1969409 RepID=A0A2A6FQ88_9MICO|nr:MAG: hypothetical protein B5766_07905 [Candidatus Lumbricidophila eiseniae]
MSIITTDHTATGHGIGALSRGAGEREDGCVVEQMVEVMSPEVTSEVDAGLVQVLALAPGEHAAVFGVPGSGKTRAIVELVADRVHRRGYSSDEILVLSASRVAASELRDRIELRLGVPGRGSRARSAVSVAFDIVKTFTGQKITLLTGAEQDQLIAELVDSGIRDGFGPQWPDELGPAVRVLSGFRGELRDLLMRVTEQGMDAEELAQLGEWAQRPEWVAAAAFLTEYENIKADVRPTQYDSVELVMFAADIVRRSGGDPTAEAALGSLAGLRLLVVDDAQEATESTAALLGAFAQRGCSVVAFGDPDIASNGFRGGRPDLLGSLPQVLDRTVRRIELPTVWRGRPELRAVVSETTSLIGAALGGTHRVVQFRGDAESQGVENGSVTPEPTVHPDTSSTESEVPSGGSTTVESVTPSFADRLPPLLGIEAPSRQVECQQIATLLREHRLRNGVPWSSMVVLVRSGREIPALVRRLNAGDVPATTGRPHGALRESPAAAALLAVTSLALCNEVATVDQIETVLLGPYGGLDGMSLRRLRLALRHEELAAGGTRTADELLVEAFAAPGGCETLRSSAGRRAAKLAVLITGARRLATEGGSIDEILWHLWHGSALATHWEQHTAHNGMLAEESHRALDATVALFAVAQRFVEREPDAPPTRFLETVMGNDLPEDSLAPTRRTESVLVATPAAVLGREFDIVVIAGLQEGVWPNLRPRGQLLHAPMLPLVRSAARAGEPCPHLPEYSEERALVRTDELRLFALAVSRARRQLVLTCTANEEEQPSPLMSIVAARRAATPRWPLHLRELVAALRREAVAGAGASASVASEALARLAVAGIPGAHPADWYGLAAPSTTAPLADLDDPNVLVSVSPSQIARVEESSLAWFVTYIAAPASGLPAAMGTIVHAAVEEIAARTDGAPFDVALLSAVDRRWQELRLESGWASERDRARIRQLAASAAAYLTACVDEGRQLLVSEHRFTAVIDRACLTGTIDRVEISADGSLQIVDLKTSSTKSSVAETARHAQLAAYQLAVRESADLADRRIGGAKLVFLETTTARPDAKEPGFTVRAQQPLTPEAEAEFRARLGAVVRAVSGTTFTTPVERDIHSPLGSWEFWIHTLPAVSAAEQPCILDEEG